jgi:hypothetical protein
LPFSKKGVELARKISYTPFISSFYPPKQLSDAPHKYDFFSDLDSLAMQNTLGFFT